MVAGYVKWDRITQNGIFLFFIFFIFFLLFFNLSPFQGQRAPGFTLGL